MAGQYEKVKFLGQGGFGKVYLVRRKQNPKKLFAMKEMSINKESIDQIHQEVKLLSVLDHPYIISLVDCSVKYSCIHIITEYCPNGDLQQFINTRDDQPLMKSLVLKWFWQITSAVKYLHSEKVIHRDLKLANIFLDSKNNCKLGDFGISRVLDCTLDMARTHAGTPCYMSPELIKGLLYNEKTDIWSLAIVIYELSTLRKAFNAGCQMALFHKITDGAIPPMPKNYSVAFQKLLSSMMKRNPNNRPSASQIFKVLKRPATTVPEGKRSDVQQAIKQHVRRRPLPSTHRTVQLDRKEPVIQRNMKTENPVPQWNAMQEPMFRPPIEPQVKAFMSASPMQPRHMQPSVQPCMQLQPVHQQPILPQIQPCMHLCAQPPLKQQLILPQMQPFMQPCMQPPLQLQPVQHQPILPQIQPCMDPCAQPPLQQQLILPQMQPFVQPWAQAAYNYPPIQQQPILSQVQPVMQQLAQPPLQQLQLLPQMQPFMQPFAQPPLQQHPMMQQMQLPMYQCIQPPMLPPPY